MPRIRHPDSIGAISEAAWDALNTGGQPFLRHAYLAGLEISGSVGPGTGWLPRPVILEDDAGSLLAAVPLYEKHNSNGEFVFDWDWAEAYAATGRDYYPKWVAAVPYTPVSGPRLLLAPGAGEAVREELVSHLFEQAREHAVSSLHWLFLTPGELPFLETRVCLVRTGCHFEWRNPGAGDFDEWLATLSSSRRKSIRRERRRVREAGIRCEWLTGTELDAETLAVVYDLYVTNYHVHGMRPYLTPRFFPALAEAMPEALAVCLAHRGKEVVAGAIFLESDDALYGRYWGAFEWIDCLHFEVCYYQGIERALARGYARFHPGVQGEHKLLRGFEPTLHYSAHWLRDEDFRRAVGHFLKRERSAVDAYADAAERYLPYRKTPR